ncbi:MAG: hypothetical protein J1F10_04520 [Muribaculaceae bacterium]|nr:hypothetical protein [Muribaculaceae bacterium]
MITKEVIKTLYRMHKTPVGYEEILPVLNNFILALKQNHNLKIDDDTLVLEDMDDDNLFKTIFIDRICGIEQLDRCFALVLPNSILFFNKDNSEINLHIKIPKPSILDRIKGKI